MPLLTVEKLSVRYRTGQTTVQAVHEVSFAIEPGEILALVGESGCGKTSAGLALANLLPHPPAEVSGRVMVNGMSVLDAAKTTLRRIRGGTIAYVFQEPATSLNPVLTIGEQLEEAVVLHTDLRDHAARGTAVEWLRLVGIPSPEARLHAYPHEFSGGMQQRAMIAMALAGRPKLLVADEPTTALDVTVQVQLLRLLRDLQQRLHLAVLLISHDLTVVERIAHRLGVMSGGRLVEMGPVEYVLRRPTHAYTKQLLEYRAMTELKRSAEANG